MMKFQLSKETLENIEFTTGRDYELLTTSPMAAFRATKDSSHNRLTSSHPRIIPPRGSVYLQTNRLMNLSEILKMLFK